MRQVYLEQISKAFPGRQLFFNLTWQINQGDKIALVGRNGAGKTTLFRIIQGEISPDSGLVHRAKTVKIGNMPQEARLESGRTLWLEMLEAFRDLLDLKDEIARLEEEIAISGQAQDRLERYGQLQERFEFSGGFEYEEKIKIVLAGLGFTPDQWLQEIRKFSGGEKNRSFLARMLRETPDLLLLDEPTNYLDIESTAWLEEYLNTFAGSVVIVSHDRCFINRVAQKVVELTSSGLETYHGNYDYYEAESAKRQLLAQKAYEHQAEEIARIQDFIQKNIAGQKTKQAQSRRKMLSKLKPLERPDGPARDIALKLRSSGRSWLKILEVKNLSKAFGHNIIFESAHLTIERNDKSALIGPNGCGKTTLIRMITGQLEPDAGEIAIGNNGDYVYYDQELQGLDLESTVIDVIWEEKPEALAEELRSYLARFLFSGEDIFRPVKSLSGGEKSRLALAKIFFNPANFLILDEPTNHLDIPSCRALELALNDFDGAVLIISHDRYFLDRTVQKIFAVENRMIVEYPGNFSEYWEKRQAQLQDHQHQPEKKETLAKRTNWQKLKDVRRHKKRIEKTEQQILEIEDRLREISAQLANPSLASDWERLIALQEEKDQLEIVLDNLYQEYDDLTQA